MPVKYFLKLETLGLETEEKEVPVEIFVQAERQAGFYGPQHLHGRPCTGGFSGNGIHGRIKYDFDEDIIG